MPYIPHTEQDVQEMLATIGADSVEALFSEIPDDLKVKKPLPIDPGMSEMQVSALIRAKAQQNQCLINYLGGGSYEHYIPACVWELATRGEFMTAYTPYQAEAAQGNLQLLWEYQTMMASLMGMQVSNASMYDGASALAEAVLMALRTRRGNTMRVWVPRQLHPHYRTVLKTILEPQNIHITEVAYDLKSGCYSMQALHQLLDEQPCDVFVISQPNFFGQVEDVDELTSWAHKQGATVVAHVNPLMMSWLKPPGAWGDTGADIACGEGQPLGVPMNYGGPYFGFLCCKMDLVRQMPGRIVGRTVDRQGNTGFTLTLQAREQHIRRGKATSNICTNQGLLVTAATIYMSVMGPHGLRQVCQRAHENAYYLYEKCLSIQGVTPVFQGYHGYEFVIQLPKQKKVKQFLKQMQKNGIQAGLDLGAYYPELGNALMICVTETKTQSDLDLYVEQLQALCSTAQKAHTLIRES